MTRPQRHPTCPLASVRRPRWHAILARFLRFFFRHLYTDLAWAYDFIAWATSMGQWRTWQQAALETLGPDPTLELGHGPGHLLADLSAAGRRAVGIDPSPQMNRLARRHAGGTPVLRARAEALPFGDRVFGTLVATFPSEYILSPETLREAWRVLRPGGQLVVVPAAEITGRAPHDRLAGWLYRVTGQSSPPHPSWQRALAQVGFNARLELVQQPRARVQRLVAVKPGAQGEFAGSASGA